MVVKSSSQISIVDITDAYSVILTSETYTFIGNASGAPSGLSCTTQVVAYCGGNACSKVSIGTITCPTGISATIKDNNTLSPTITFTTTGTISTACEAIIPVNVDSITINKKFSFAVAKQGVTGAAGPTGATGNGISKTEIMYYLSTSSTTQTGGSWSTSVPTWVDGRYYWQKIKTTYTNGTTSESTPVCITGGKGATGATGSTGKGVASITTEFYLSTSKTTQSGGSWTTTMPTWSSGKYLWTRSKIVYTNPSSTAYTTPICDSSWEAVNDVENNLTTNYYNKVETDSKFDIQKDSIISTVTKNMATADSLTDVNNSLTDVTNDLQNSINATNQNLQDVQNNQNEVYQIISENKTQISSLVQRAEGFTMDFKTVNETVKQINDQFVTERDERYKYIKFIDGEIWLGKEVPIGEDDFKLVIKNDRISFLQNKMEVAYMSNNKLYVTDIHVTNSLQLGYFIQSTRSNGNIGIRWVNQ